MNADAHWCCFSAVWLRQKRAPAGKTGVVAQLVEPWDSIPGGAGSTPADSTGYGGTEAGAVTETEASIILAYLRSLGERLRRTTDPRQVLRLYREIVRVGQELGRRTEPVNNFPSHRENPR